MLLVGCRSGTTPSSPLSVDLVARNAGPVGSTLTLEATVSSTVDLPQTELVFQLPEGVVPIRGDVSQQFDLVANKPQSFKLDVQITKEGTSMISAYATGQTRAAKVGGSKTLWLTITQVGTEIRDEQPYTPRPSNMQPLFRVTETPTP